MGMSTLRILWPVALTRSVGVMVLVVSVSASCSREKKAPAYEIRRKDECAGRSDGVVCQQGVAFTCADGGVSDERDCHAEKLTCDLQRGCERCRPYGFDCVDNSLYRCNAAGTKSTFEERCPDDLQCSALGCRDLCKDAEAKRSYIGCEYWPVFTGNSQLDPIFKPAIAVANPNLVTAQVTVSLAGRTIAERKIERAGVAVIPLEFDPVLKGVIDPDQLRSTDSLFSVQQPDLAYHLVSDVPVTVHQFNPLLFHVDESCVNTSSNGQAVSGECDSFTNDASLLLPVHALQSDYIVVARPSFMVQVTDTAMQKVWEGLPGFVAIVGVQEPPTAVRIRTRAHTLASRDDSIRALAPGDELSVTLSAGEVLQLLGAVPGACTGTEGGFPEEDPDQFVTCDPGADYDLTGTEIEADGPIQVISGNDCVNVPFHTPACDHLEEALFPLATWGTQVMVTRPAALDGEPHVFRVVSGDDDNPVTFDPPVHERVTLDRGEFVEIQTDQHVAVRGKKRILVAQFLVGQGASKREGDPAMGLAVPTDQYLSRYVFLSPDTYDDKFVNVIVYDDTEVALDGDSINGFEPIGNSEFRVATVRLGDEKEHVVESADGSKLGLIVYGYANFTSYMLPAGLDLQLIGAPF